MKKKSRYVIVHYQEMSSYLLFAARRKEMEDESRAQKLIDGRGADVQPTIYTHSQRVYTHTQTIQCVLMCLHSKLCWYESSKQDKS